MTGPLLGHLHKDQIYEDDKSDNCENSDNDENRIEMRLVMMLRNVMSTHHIYLTLKNASLVAVIRN